MRIDYDFADLEVFLAVRETGSFHAAARRLNLSQSAITRRVQRLEAALDSVLFERTTRRVRPTLAAKRLQARAEAILEDAHETARAMRDDSVAHAHQRGQVVTVAAIPTVIADLVCPALRDVGPVRLRLLDMAANEVADAVSGGEADFGLCSIPAMEPGLRFEALFDDRMVLVLPAGHDLAALQVVPWDRLDAVPLILPARGTGNRMLIDDALARARLSLTWAVEAGRSSTALALVQGGAGAAILPLSALRGAAPGGAVWRPLGPPEIARPVGLLTRTGQVARGAAAALGQAVRQAAAARAAS